MYFEDAIKPNTFQGSARPFYRVCECNKLVDDLKMSV